MVLCKVRLVGVWIKRRKVVVGARRIRSEKLMVDWYKEGYARSLDGKRLEGDGDNVNHMWEQVKWAMVESKRYVWLSESGGKESKECVVE